MRLLYVLSQATRAAPSESRQRCTTGRESARDSCASLACSWPREKPSWYTAPLL